MSEDVAAERRARIYVQVTVDLAILTVRDGSLQILLIRRGNEPYQNHLALPGGFIREGEGLREAAHRELGEETGLDSALLHLTELGAYGAPDRDPRGRIISVAFLAIAPNLPSPVAGTDAVGARWMPVESALADRTFLAFDHFDIATDAVERARTMLEQTMLAPVFCAPEFTMGELREVYEVVWGIPLDPRNFSRKVKNTPDFVKETGNKRSPAIGRPAILYTAASPSDATLYPAMLRHALKDDAAEG
ncbi:NUDIX hydrolase [Actinoplanes sp. NPDC051513]|uniref:NUDIX hydrolase n=1 Tax=Actinoplanes sp. NPDC051513 TaxID=3363908 RepID=UPI0037B3A6E1